MWHFLTRNLSRSQLQAGKRCCKLWQPRLSTGHRALVTLQYLGEITFRGDVSKQGQRFCLVVARPVD